MSAVKLSKPSTIRTTRGLILYFFILLLVLTACEGNKIAPEDNTPDPPIPPTNWIWISGSDMADQVGNYGILGTTAPSNMPGARLQSVSWKDLSGNFWLFGGICGDENHRAAVLNDLWKYDPATYLWTWVSGSNLLNQEGVYADDLPNIPGGRTGAVSWTGQDGSLWFFGGYGIIDIYIEEYGDLWKYEPSTNTWTWISRNFRPYQTSIYGTKGIAAPTNTPGARSGGVSWADSDGNFWLFGGVHFGEFNDLWKYNPLTNEWTWVSGSNLLNQVGIYGIKGLPGTENNPGARMNATSWIDSDGNLWLFGGAYRHYLNEPNQTSYLNDLWRYDPINNQWTWISGQDTPNQPGVYGIMGVASPSNVPGARRGGVSWISPDGNLWLFGGHSREGYFNDLWKYDPLTNEWAWISGVDNANGQPVYGTKLVAASNVPGARFGGLSWIDSSGTLWLFGGGGLATHREEGALNDLWKFAR